MKSLKTISKKWGIVLCGIAVAAVSIGGTSFYYSSKIPTSAAPAAAVHTNSPNPNYEFLVGATAWQLSAESQALMMQAFSGAQHQVQQYVQQCESTNQTSWKLSTAEDGTKAMYCNGKRVAIICDIDDALVDGAHYTADVVGNDGDMNNVAFARFILSDACTALPGSVDFLKECAANGIEIYYITNRSDQGYKIGQSDSQGSYEDSKKDEGKGLYIDAEGKEIGTSTYQTFGKSMYDITLERMTELGFPIDDQHLFVNDSKLDGTSKEKDRAAIINGAQNHPNGRRADGNASNSTLTLSCPPHNVVMMFGDSINDFTDVFSDPTLDAVTRTALAEQYADKWGKEWIVLPNAMYGNVFDYAGKYGYRELLKQYAYTTKAFAK